LVLTGAGSVADKNVGANKPVTLGTLALGNSAGTGGGLASNYTFAGGTHTATITQLPSVSWTATAPGNWSTASNWAGGAIPDVANVAAVVIPASASVTFDAAMPATQLQSLSGGGALTIAGSTLGVAVSLSTPQFSQTGGSLNGTGSLTVSNSFSQSAGSIAMGGVVDITQAAGNLSVGSISGAHIKLAAPAGGISQTGALVTAGLLDTQALNGIVLNDLGNRVSAFAAKSSTSGNIELQSVGALDVRGMDAANGNITVNNWHGISTSKLIRALRGGVSLTANSPLTIGSEGIIASGDISLTANNTQDGNMQINGPIKSSAGSVSMTAASNFTQNSAVEAALGVTATGGTMTIGANATTIGNPVSYLAAGVPASAPPASLNPVTTPPDNTTSTFNNTFDQMLLDLVFEPIELMDLFVPDPLSYSMVVSDPTDPLAKKEPATAEAEVSTDSTSSSKTVSTSSSVAPATQKRDKSIIVVEGATCTR
jgi:hypothetical protein